MSATASPLLSPQDELEQDVEEVTTQLTELDPSAEPESSPSVQSSGLSASVTRTVGIIKNHALQHRFEIERKIQEAGFEIVKERQMEFDVETDPDTLFELFGEDAESFVEGPVWVYVLERRRAVEVWLNLMGDKDPVVARRDAPNSIRALHGISTSQNGIMGSSDRDMAEIQIASLFASSPPFPTSELPDDQYGTVNSVSSSVMSALRNGGSQGSATNPRSTGSSRKSLSNLFSARPLPKTHTTPESVPRLTKAASLRAGTLKATRVGSMGALPSSVARQAITKERQTATFQNIPGHKRAGTISVASTAAPSVAPRMTKAAALRAGIKFEPPAPRRVASDVGQTTRSSSFDGISGQKRPSVNGHQRSGTITVASTAAPAVAPRMTRTASLRTGVKPDSAPIKRPPSAAGGQRSSSFDGVPGHKRRETITVASVAAPTVAPRMTKAASLRQGPKAPPTSFMFRGPSESSVPGLSRSNSRSSLTGQSRPSSQMSMGRPASRATSVASSAAGYTNGQGAANVSSSSDKDAPPKRPAPRASSVSNPSIVPRTNKSAALRAAKKAEEEEAARKAEEKARKMSRRRTIGVLPRAVAA